MYMRDPNVAYASKADEVRKLTLKILNNCQAETDCYAHLSKFLYKTNFKTYEKRVKQNTVKLPFVRLPPFILKKATVTHYCWRINHTLS